MNSGFIKRAFSSFVDLAIVILIVYLTFIIAGQKILQNQVENFDEIYASYNEVVDAYNVSLNALYEEYTAAQELANGDETALAAAEATYNAQKSALDAQNTIDIEPFNEPLTGYFLNCIFYYVIGVLVLMSIYSVAFLGKTLGRKFMQLKLEGPVNPISVFFHDIVFKYFFVVLVFAVSMYAGIILLGLSLIVDLVMMSFTPKKATLRDLLLKMSVVKTGYGY